MLIKNVADLKAALPTIQKNLTFATWQGYIQAAEREYVVKWIGVALYNEINQVYNSGTPFAKQLELLSYLQPCVAHYALSMILPFLAVSIAEQGVVQNNSTDFAPARQADIEQANRQALKLADSFLEQTLEFLELNKANFATWVSSTAYTLSKELLINSANELSQYIGALNNSRRAFLRLRPDIALWEQMGIARVVSAELLAEIKGQIASNNVNPNNQKLLAYMRPALANLVMAKTLPMLSGVISQDGSIAFVTYQVSFGKVDREIMQAKMQEAAKAYQANADLYLMELKAYLDANASTYPLYLASNIYTPPPTAEEVEERNLLNDVSKSFMV